MDAIIHRLLYILVKALHLSFRYEYLNPSMLAKAKGMSVDNNFIIATWHQNFITTFTSHMEENFVVIVSPSKDGEYVSRLCEKFGVIPCRGSSSRGGRKALVELVEIMKKKIPAAITVDGPKGPAKKTKWGILEISSKSRAPILPVFAEANSYWQFSKSWDKFKFPKPFTKIKVKYGEPILIPENLGKSELAPWAEKLENSLNSLED